MSPTWYPTTRRPKSYGSGLPLPSRTAAHFPAFKPKFCPIYIRVIPGLPYLLPISTKEKSGEKRTKHKTRQPKRPTMPSRPPIPPSPPGRVRSSPRPRPRPYPPPPGRWGLILRSLAPCIVGAAISHRALLILPAPLGGIGLLVLIHVGAQEWAVIGRMERRHGQSSGNWKNYTASAAHTWYPPM